MPILYIDEPDMLFLFSLTGSNTEVNAIISRVIGNISDSLGLTSPMLNEDNSYDMKYVYEQGGFSMEGMNI